MNAAKISDNIFHDKEETATVWGRLASFIIDKMKIASHNVCKSQDQIQISMECRTNNQYGSKRKSYSTASPPVLNAASPPRSSLPIPSRSRIVENYVVKSNCTGSSL